MGAREQGAVATSSRNSRHSGLSVLSVATDLRSPARTETH